MDSTILSHKWQLFHQRLTSTFTKRLKMGKNTIKWCPATPFHRDWQHRQVRMQHLTDSSLQCWRRPQRRITGDEILFLMSNRDAALRRSQWSLSLYQERLSVNIICITVFITVQVTSHGTQVWIKQVENGWMEVNITKQTQVMTHPILQLFQRLSAFLGLIGFFIAKKCNSCEKLAPAVSTLIW